MKFIPEDASKSIEFDKILNLLQGHCISTAAKSEVQLLPFLSDPQEIKRQLATVQQYKDLLMLSKEPPLAFFDDISKAIEELKRPDFVLEIGQLIEINQVVSIIFGIDEFFKAELKDKESHLYKLLEHLDKPLELKEAIPNIINEDGEVKETASPELAQIIRAIKSKEKEVQKEFNLILLRYKEKGLLSQNEESYRNGRRVLSIPSEYKRQIKGIIHDESTTGKTSFIEPETVVYINNEILELELDKRKEIYKILKKLCGFLRQYADTLHLYFESLITLDLIRAKARLANDLQANMPEIVDHPCINLKKAFHPLLYLKNRDSDTEVIPFDLELKNNNRIFLISGPNAGGKSITLKTVGLIQLMLQIGCLVPANPDSKIGIFSGLFCDIGDQQSLEDDLSTYSSRLKNMKDFLNMASPETLILIDEFGSGTDPKLGGSIAQSILFELNKKLVFAVITTHYSNLKVFAHKTKGIVNGAMHFDQEKLQPTYELLVGKPGSSFAFEIAEKVGLSKRLLHFAKKNAGVNLSSMETLINDLQTQQRTLEEKLDQIARKEKKLDKLTANYLNLQQELDLQRKKFKRSKKEFEINDTVAEKKQLEKLIKDLREEQNIEKAKEKLKSVKEKQKHVEKVVHDLNDEIHLRKGKEEPIAIGDYVTTRNGALTGILTKINKKEAILQSGNMQISALLADCIKVNSPLNTNPTKRVNTYLARDTSGTESNIDIRGYRRSEALILLEEFLDNALIANLSRLKIIHGTGNGVLKKAVRQKLREYKDVNEISSPPAEQGGEGVTLVKF